MAYTGWDGAGAVFALALRVARLAVDGAPAVGVSNMYVSNALVKIDFEPQYKEGTKIEDENGSGELCVSYEGDDTLLNYKVTIELCTPDPELSELLGGGTVLSNTGAAVGLASPAVGGIAGHANGVSVEAFARAVLDGGSAPDLPFIHHVFPKIRKLKPTGSRTIGAENMHSTFEGIAVGNANWGDGPKNDWDLASDKPHQWARVAAVPAAVLGYQAVIADAP